MAEEELVAEAIRTGHVVAAKGLFETLSGTIAENFSVLLAGVLFWSVLQLLSTVLPPKFKAFQDFYKGNPEQERYKREFPVNFAATCHAIIASQASVRILLWPPQGLDPNDLYSTSELSQFYLALSCSYFLWDLGITFYFGYGWLFVVHATCGCFVFLGGMYPFLQYIGFVFLAYELSTPFIHIRWFLTGLGRDSGLLYTACTALFALNFAIFRIGIGLPASYFWWGQMLELLQEGRAHCTSIIVLYLGSNIIMNSLNVLWFAMILKATFCSSEAERNKTHIN